MRNHARRVLQVLWPCLISGSYAVALAAEEKPNSVDAHTRYEHRQQHDPNGIGKFYLGREIAHVMGHQAADWLERPEREAEEKPELLLQALKLKSGDAVAINVVRWPDPVASVRTKGQRAAAAPPAEPVSDILAGTLP